MDRLTTHLGGSCELGSPGHPRDPSPVLGGVDSPVSCSGWAHIALLGGVFWLLIF